jgi:hypothetical protein
MPTSCIGPKRSRFVTRTFRDIRNTAKSQCLCVLFAVPPTEEPLPGVKVFFDLVKASMQPAAVVASVVAMIATVRIVLDQNAIRPCGD